MKTMLSLLLILTAHTVGVQAQETKLIFRINGSITSSIYPKGPLPQIGKVQVEIQGLPNPDCRLHLSSVQFPCQNLTIQEDGSIGSSSIKINRPFEVKLTDSGQQSQTYNIPGQNTPPGSNQSDALNADKKRRVAEAQVCADAGPKLLWKDALDLQKAIADTNMSTIKAILCKYYLPDSSCATCIQQGYQVLYDLVQRDGNHFLIQVLPPRGSTDEPYLIDAGNRQSVIESQVGTFETAVSAPNILLNAIGSFIAKRLIDELNRAYLDKFRAKLDSPQLADFRAILPQTRNFLGSIGQGNTIDYKSLLSSIRNNFFEDLSNLALNAPQLLRNHRAEIIAQRGTELYVAGLAMLELVNSLQQKTDPAEVVSRLGRYDYEQGTALPSNTLTILRLVAAISNHLRLNDPYGPWIDVTAKFQNPRTVLIFAGLMFRADSALLDTNSLNLNGQRQSVRSLILNRNTEKFVESIHQVLGLIVDIGKLPSLAGGTETDRFLALNERLLTFAVNCATGAPNQPAFQQALETMQILIRIKGHIQEKNFVAAGTLVFHWLDRLGVDVASQNRQGRREFFRYLSFAQNLIDAKDEKEMIAALEQAADPVGSFRLKRQHPMTASITSYPGLFIGREQYRDGVNNKTIFNNFGFTAPLGLAVSFSRQDLGPGIREYADNESPDPKTSWTIFMPILDVGAISAFRLLDDSAELPETKWSNFLAPGLFLNLGFKNSLLTLHTGFQIGPEAQQLNSPLKPRLWRFGLGLSADLHLWSIYNKAERR